MALPKQQDDYISVEEYLAFERNAEFKHEYAYGEIIAMSGASPNHILITGNLTTALNIALRDTQCLVLPTDMRVHAKAMTTYRYPDVSVVCEDTQYTDDNPPSLLNPMLLIEVTSPSTIRTDHNLKLDEYRTIPSLQAYLLVSQDQPKIQYFRRPTSGTDWGYNALTQPTDTFSLSNPALTLKLADVYRKVTFDESNSP